MKKIFITLFLALNLASFAQSNNEVQISISIEEIKKLNTLHDLIPNFPKDCKIFSCNVIMNLSDQVLASKSSDRNFIKETKDLILKRKDKIQSFVIQEISSNCDDKLSKIYRFTIKK